MSDAAAPDVPATLVSRFLTPCPEGCCELCRRPWSEHTPREDAGPTCPSADVPAEEQQEPTRVEAIRKMVGMAGELVARRDGIEAISEHVRGEILWLVSALQTEAFDGAERLATLKVATYCPYCGGDGQVETGGFPDVNGYAYTAPCRCGDGTMAGALQWAESRISTLTSERSALRGKIEAMPVRKCDNIGHTKIVDHLERDAVLAQLPAEDET